ncbi:hypothetical protein ACRAWD_29550 [Caulobacter segnis]
MNSEIAGHEFFSADGKWIWYDLQTPRGQVFWIAGHELTGRKLYRRVEQNSGRCTTTCRRRGVVRR